MKQLSQEEKEKISTRLFWDMKIEPSELLNLLDNENIDTKDPNVLKFFRRLLISCDWYTILKLISLEKLRKMLSDQMIESLFPMDLKKRYFYVRKVLSRKAVPFSR